MNLREYPGTENPPNVLKVFSFVLAEGDQSLNDPVCCTETLYFLKLEGCPAWIVNLLEKVCI